MALDGIVLSNIVHELNDTLIGGRIDKIYQPEKDELLLSIRSNRVAYKLLLTANSNYPRLHLSQQAKQSPAEPPMFCMLLRKHISGGKIVSITQPLFERIVEIHIEATNELGDKEHKKLIIEIMGRHSNIILTKENYTILDSIKHISADKSSVRQVLPNKEYTYPPNQNKLNPITTDLKTFTQTLSALNVPLFKGLYLSYSGLSPVVAHEICHRTHLSSDVLCHEISSEAYEALYATFNDIVTLIKRNDFSPVTYLDTENQPLDFHSVQLSLLADHSQLTFDSVSAMLENYYHEKTNRFNVSQKTADIKKLIHNFVDRTVRKKIIQEKAIEESNQSELYRMYGELITSYSYSIAPGSESFTTINYYEEPFEELTIPLDKQLTAIENAQRYFKTYNKAKRTLIAAEEQLAVIEEDLHYLNSVLVSLDILQTEEDIAGLRQELTDMGYMRKRKQSNKKQPKNNMPYMQFKSSSGLPIFVGKNNYQNDALTMKFAKPSDMWLHIKDGPGSHVIIRIEHGQEL
ncbi:MAG: Rqc2 family fibronectin-binding protein, partial [Cellulosilyticaceae bacterium]